MGARIVQLVHEDAELTVGAGMEYPNHPRLGADVGELCGLGKLGVALTSKLVAGLDVAIDFSSPEGAMSVTEQCLEHRVPLVMATTGFTSSQRAEIEEASQDIALLMAPNMSVAVNLLMKL